jgi:hypothetical protein
MDSFSSRIDSEPENGRVKVPLSKSFIDRNTGSRAGMKFSVDHTDLNSTGAKRDHDSTPVNEFMIDLL